MGSTTSHPGQLLLSGLADGEHACHPFRKVGRPDHDGLGVQARRIASSIARAVCQRLAGPRSSALSTIGSSSRGMSGSVLGWWTNLIVDERKDVVVDVSRLKSRLIASISQKITPKAQMSAL